MLEHIIVGYLICEAYELNKEVNSGMVDDQRREVLNQKIELLETQILEYDMEDLKETEIEIESYPYYFIYKDSLLTYVRKLIFNKEERVR